MIAGSTGEAEILATNCEKDYQRIRPESGLVQAIIAILLFCARRCDDECRGGD